jgi:hypothetical protein
VFEGSKESLLQAGANKPIGFLDLPVGLGVCHRRVLDLDAQLFGELLKFARGEVSTVVGDDAVGYPVSAGDGIEELDHRSCFLVGDQYCFDPLGEFVDGD